MSRASVLRPIGFSPGEISALVNSDVISQHAEEAAFQWTRRSRAVGEPHYSLTDLAAVDERVEAHLDGLRVAGSVGWDFCKRHLVTGGPGEVFALAVLAFGAGNPDQMREALIAGCGSQGLRPGLISALGWLAYDTVSEWLRRLVEANAPEYRSIGIAGYAIHRQDPGSVLELAVDDADAVLRARALRCAGEIKRHDLLESIRNHLNDENETCRFWAAWTVTLLGGGEGLSTLIRFAEENTAHGERALQLALRVVGLNDSRRWISSLARESQCIRLAVMGAGVIGDPVFMPWLIRKMESPDLARLAGEAFTMITGVDLTYHDLSQDAAPQPDTVGIYEAVDDIISLDYESNLPWPSARLVREWWEKNRQTLSADTRYLGGKPVSKESAIEILIAGKQRLRTAAALELALLDSSGPLFEVRARGTVQQGKLEKWK